MTEKFDILAFLNYCGKIVWIKQTMEIKLADFKKKNPTVDTSEQQEIIDQLGALYVWVHELEREYNAMCKVSLENNRANLVLTNKIAELEKEITVLKHFNNDNN
jgi:hypothetical protein